MSTTVSTAKELGTAISNNDNQIIIEGSLGDAVITINAIGPVAWAVAIGAIGVAIAGIAITAGTAGAGAPVGAASELVAAPALIATLGSASTATTAIGIAAAGGGVGVLSSMRRYKAKREGGKVVLTKRW